MFLQKSDDGIIVNVCGFHINKIVIGSHQFIQNFDSEEDAAGCAKICNGIKVPESIDTSNCSRSPDTGEMLGCWEVSDGWSVFVKI